MKGLIGLYFCIAFVVALYGNWWGDYAFRGFFYNLGRGIIWPVIMFPSLVPVVSGVVVVGFVILLLMSKR